MKFLNYAIQPILFILFYSYNVSLLAFYSIIAHLSHQDLIDEARSGSQTYESLYGVVYIF